MTDCLELLKKIAGGDFSEQELASILSKLWKSKNANPEDILAASNKGINNVYAEMQKVSDKLLKDELKKEYSKKIDRLQNSAIRAKFLNVAEKYATRTKVIKGEKVEAKLSPDHMLTAITSGTGRMIDGARFSAGNQVTEKVNFLTGTMARGSQKIGGLSDLLSGKHDNEIIRAMNGKLTGNGVYDRQGEFLKGMLKDCIAEAARYGAFIEEDPNWGVATVWNKRLMMQTHDNWWDERAFRVKLIGNINKNEIILNAARDRWIDYVINDYADLEKTLGRNEISEGAKPPKKTDYNFEMSANYDGPEELLEDEQDDRPIKTAAEVRKWFEYAYKSITNNYNLEGKSNNIIERLTGGRKIIPKNEDAQVANMRKYGMGTLKDTMEHTLINFGTNITLLKNFGSNPAKMIDTITDDAFAVAKAHGTEFFKTKIDEVKAKAKLILAVIDGSAFDNNSSAARVGGALRTWNTIKLLPSTVTMGWTVDQAAVAQQLNHMGVPYMKGIFNISKNLLKDIHLTEDRLQLADLVHVYNNTGMGSLMRLTGSVYGEQVSKLGKVFMNFATTLSGHRRMTFSKELSIGGVMARLFAKNKNLDFDSLPDHFSSDMKLYDITPAMWNLIRDNPTNIPGAGEFIGSDAVKYTSDDAIRGYLKSEGIDATNYNKTSLARVRDDVSNRWATYIRDQISHGVMSPDAASKAFWLFGHKATTPAGHVLQAAIRLFSAFRMYETSLLTKPLARMALGKGADTYFDAIFRGQGNWMGFIKFASTAYVMSMIYQGISSEIGGKKFDTPYDFFARSLETSGFAGLFSRLVPSPRSTPTRMIENLGGPIIGSILETAITGEKAITGQLTKKAAYNYLTQNTPFINYVYFRKALNYLFLREVQLQLTGVDTEKTNKHYFMGG